MAKKGNTLTRHVRDAHHALGLANFIAFRAHVSAGREVRRIEKGINAGNGDFLITGASVAGCDIYADPPQWVFYGGKLVKGEEQIELINEADGMVQADALVTAYEVMEQFVKKLTVEYLYCKRGSIPIENKWKQRTLRHFGRNKITPQNTKPWFEQVVGVLAAQNTQPLFAMLFKRIAGLHERIASFPMGDPHVTHRAVEFIRHCKTHANGRYDPNRLTSMLPEVQKQVAPCIRKSFLNATDWILPSHDEAREFIAREAEYAQLLYDTITRDLSMELEWTPGRDPKGV